MITIEYNKNVGQNPLQLDGRVYRRDEESVDSMLKRFKKVTIKAEIIKDYKKHEFYESKSIRKRKKHEAAQKREMRNKMKYMKNIDLY